VPFPIASALVGGLQSDSIVMDPAARLSFAEVSLIPFGQAVEDALADLRPERLEPVWEGLGRDTVTLKHEGFLLDHRRLHVEAPPQVVFDRLVRLGTAGGWPYANRLWRLRGWVDRLISQDESGAQATAWQPTSRDAPLTIGDRVDYYRVEAMEPGCVLRLRSDLRAPGDGWMEWRVQSSGAGTRLSQTAFFAPRGLPGFLYWFALAPLHALVFRGLIRALKQQSEPA
jgi:hypothetical protein